MTHGHAVVGRRRRARPRPRPPALRRADAAPGAKPLAEFLQLFT